MMLHVTTHALERYRRRVENVSEREAYLALSSDSIRQAATVGCSSVILPSGHKVVLHGFNVVTVKPRHKDKRRVR